MIENMTLDELKREYEIAKQRFHAHMSIKNGAHMQELRDAIAAIYEISSAIEPTKVETTKVETTNTDKSASRLWIGRVGSDKSYAPQHP